MLSGNLKKSTATLVNLMHSFCQVASCGRKMLMTRSWTSCPMKSTCLLNLLPQKLLNNLLTKKCLNQKLHRNHPQKQQSQKEKLVSLLQYSKIKALLYQVFLIKTLLRRPSKFQTHFTRTQPSEMKVSSLTSFQTEDN